MLDPKGWVTIYTAGQDAEGNPVWTKDHTGESLVPTITFTEDSTGKFTLEPETPKVGKVDIYNIMNVSTFSRKVILRKVEDGTYKSLSGATFEILRADRTLVSSTDINGATTTTFTSGESGVYFIDKLPYGIYYLHETDVPTGYKSLADTNDNWFILTVNENGVGYEETNEEGVKTIKNGMSPESSKPD